MAPSLWHPDARIVRAPVDGGSMLGGPARSVIHTTESMRYTPSTDSYYGHQHWPHATLHINDAGEAVLYQHIPADRAARALVSKLGGVPTNRAGSRCFQLEITWTSAEIEWLPPAALNALRSWMRWTETHGVAPFALPPGEVVGSYGERAPQRMSPHEWAAFSGHCGHRHVPDNKHWDPGALDLRRLLPDEEDDMRVSLYVDPRDGRVWACSLPDLVRRWVPGPNAVRELEAKGAAPLTHTTADVIDTYREVR